MKPSVIVAGGGIAGLTAASLLAADHDVIILEAAPNCGGRIRSTGTKDFPAVIEAGPEFIHGHLKQTIALLNEAGIAYTPVEGKMYRYEKEMIIEQQDMIEDWDKLLKKMSRVDDEINMYDFLQENFVEDKFSDLRRHAIAYTEGFDVADVKQVTVKSLYKEWAAEDEENFRIPEGYGALTDYLMTRCEQQGCRIFTNETVKQVDWEEHKVAVITSSGEKYNADSIIITVPVSVLQKTGGISSINFTPPLDDYIGAAKHIGFGTVIKVLIAFHQPFWKKDMGYLFSDEYFPTWWTQLPDTGAMLTGWAGGGKAEQLVTENDDELVQKALLSLSNIFHIPLNEIQSNVKAVKVFNWSNDVLAMGAYSYEIPGSTTAKKLLNTPIQNTIFFCGEALYEGTCPGTVEAAIINAREVVRKMR